MCLFAGADKVAEVVSTFSVLESVTPALMLNSCSTHVAFLVTVSHSSLLLVLSTAADLVLLNYTESLALTHLVKKSVLQSDLESVHHNMDIETNSVC